MMRRFIALILLAGLFATPAEAGPRAEVIRSARSATALVVALNDATHSVSLGSGFFLSDEGLLVTNAHVVEGGSRFLVYVHDDVIVPTPELLTVDADADLAAFRVPTSSIETLSLSTGYPEEGADVVSVGYPRITDILQMGFALHSTIGPGTISGIVQGRSRTSGHITPFVQTTGILNFGNSGGPLIDVESGEVVGMVVTTVPYLERAKDRNGTAIGSVSMKSGIGYSIPSSVIRQWLENQGVTIPETKRVRAPLAARRGEPDAARSFATGHLLHTIAQVLHRDSDLLRLAVFHYETAAKMKPHVPWIARNLGQAYADDGQWPQALQAYLRCLEHAPNDPTLLTEVGIAWEQTGDATHALESYRAALRINPSLGKAHSHLGHLLWENGHTDEAINEFKAALKVDPSLAFASYILGRALESKGLHTEALTTWESFLQRSVGQGKGDEWTIKIREEVSRLKSSVRASLSTAATASTQ